MNPPHDSTAAAAPCSGCLDLQPKLYRRLHDGNHTWNNFERLGSLKYVDTHYYISSFSKIEEMSKRGCKFCSILDQGMRHFWDLDTIVNSALELNIDGAECNGETQFSISSGNHAEDFYRACIEIRPGRGLLVSLIHRNDIIYGDRTNFVSAEAHFGRVRAPLEFYSIYDGEVEPIPPFGRSVNIPTNLTASRCGQLLNEWLQECNAHEDCRTRLDAGCPNRLIQVAGSLVHLIDAGPQFKENYTTLSHRWGTEDDAKNMFKTTKSNLKTHQESICWDSLPRTFQDAITITRSVSCKYIWIDSLCIIQKEEEDDDDTDWKEQAPQMSSIYANSYLNIAATASHDGNGGLMFPRFSLNEDITSSGRTPVESVKLSHGVAVRPDLEHAHTIFFEEDEARNLEKGKLSPLLTRAWVFQEQVLPGRTVHFTYSELVWECRHHTVCECGGLNDWGQHHKNARQLFNNSITGKDESDTMLTSWRKCVSTYSKLEITNNKDWPFAIAGIASRLQPHVKSRYLAGLWEADFPTALMWRVHFCSSSKPVKEDHWEPSEDTPPTWSWLRCISSWKSAGISPRICHLWKDEDVIVPDSNFEFNLTDITDKPDHDDRLIFLTNVRLKLRGLVLKVLVTSEPYDGNRKTTLILRFPGNGYQEGWPDFPLPSRLRQSESEALLLLVGQYNKWTKGVWPDKKAGLILSDIGSNGSFYVRIGMFWCSLELFEGAEVREIEIR